MLYRNALVWVASFALVGVAGIAVASAQQCNDFDVCTVNDMCTVEEGFPVCVGTPAAGPGCDDDNECTINDRCGVDPDSGEIWCIGDNAPVDTPCQGGCGTCQSFSPFPIPGFPLLCQPIQAKIGQACDSNNFGPCYDTFCQALGAGDFQIAFCNGAPKTCPDTDGDPCTDNCNFETGTCQRNAPKCFPPCATCNRSSGLCEPANMGAACDDFNECSAESHCGMLFSMPFCVPGPPTASSPTPTRSQAPLTPTRTATTGAGTPLPTATATRPVATRTPTRVAVTVTPGGPLCAGDCDNNFQVAINELVRGVNIALETAPVSQCPSFDKNGNDKVEINELVGAVNNALNGCPA